MSAFGGENVSFSCFLNALKHIRIHLRLIPKCVHVALRIGLASSNVLMVQSIASYKNRIRNLGEYGLIFNLTDFIESQLLRILTPCATNLRI